LKLQHSGALAAEQQKLYRVESFPWYGLLVTKELGLRERKKRQTRQMISDVATMMFAERGFDQVTVAEVAAAANVSKMTVFNYFPRKEDLLLDRQSELVDLLTGAIRGRSPGESVVAAVRHLMLDLTEWGHPLSGVLDGTSWFWKIVDDSPALQTRVRQLGEELQAAVVQALAEGTGATAHDPTAAMVGGAVIAAQRALHTEARRRLVAGERADDIRADQMRLVTELFTLLESGLGSYGASALAGAPHTASAGATGSMST
jgi:AcrR family transcriptional regulator